MDDIFQGILVGLFIYLLISLALLLIFRALVLWYFKINVRLREQQKTNELLQNIYDALVQGNTLSAMQVGSTESLKSKIVKGQTAAEQNAAMRNVPPRIPQAGEVDNSLPPL